MMDVTNMSGGAMAAGNKYRTCAFVTGYGQKIVYVLPGCPKSTLCVGTLVCNKNSCRKCRAWKDKKNVTKI